MASLWDYDEINEMEQLGQKLMQTTMELDKLKAETTNEMRKNNEYVNDLIELVKCAIYQRDEARNQLQNLLKNNNIITTTATQIVPNSSITESNSISEYLSQDSPREISNISLPVNQPLVQISNACSVDQGSLIIDSLAKNCVLPQKGRFLQAVIEAGPLLQTLRLAGPLPTWRNPPQLQSFEIPTVSVNVCDSEMKPGTTVGRWIGDSRSYAQMSCGSSGIVYDNGCFRLAKRQRFC